MFDNKKLTTEQKNKLKEIFFNYVYSGTVTDEEFEKAFDTENKQELLKELLEINNKG